MQTRDKAPIKVIDISHWQTVKDWQAIKDSGVKGVYLKATEGDYFTDPTFRNNVLGAQSVGLLVGAYHYVKFSDPVAEAANFKNATGGLYLDLMPVLDVEEDPGLSDVTQWVRNFITADSHPYMFYSYSEWLQDHPVELSDLPLWIADYRQIDSPPDVCGWTEYAMWQYNDKGSVSGIVGNGIDLDAAVSLDAIKAEQIVNPTVKRTTTSALHLRVAPGTEYAIRATLVKGQEITIDRLYGDWAHTIDGHKWGGWVDREFLTKTKTESDIK